MRPELVVEVRFSNWTDEGYLRHPIFLGLRDDVAPASVRREADAPVQSPPGPVKVPSEHPHAAVAAALETMGERGSGTLVLGDGTKLKFGNMNKVLWPKLGFTKLDLLRYYVAVAPALLPVIEDRPLVMKRLPNGVDAPAFYQHRAPEAVPKGVRAEAVPGDEEVPTRFVGGDLGTLLHMAQLAAISMVPWFSRIQSPDEMDFAAIDLDPMDAAPFSRVRDIARWVRDELATLGVTGWLKTSGASGLHIYLPMRPGTSFETGMLFCQVIATLVSRRHPEAATSNAWSRSATSPRSTSTTCRTCQARRWPAPTAPGPASTPARRRPSPGRSWTIGWTRAPSRSGRCRSGCSGSAICGRGCATRPGSTSRR